MSDPSSKSPAGRLEPAVVEDLLNLAAVAEGGIVSRTLAKTTGGSLTLFAFDTGQSLSEHSAPFDAIVQVLEGRLEIRIAGEPVVPSAGQAVLMPADVPHGLVALEPTRMLLVMLRGDRE